MSLVRPLTHAPLPGAAAAAHLLAVRTLTGAALSSPSPPPPPVWLAVPRLCLATRAVSRPGRLAFSTAAPPLSAAATAAAAAAQPHPAAAHTPLAPAQPLSAATQPHTATLAPAPPPPARNAEATVEEHAQAPAEAAARPGPERVARPRSKLRPRKAAVTLTPAAVAHVKALLEGPEPRLLRIGTRRRGCSGLAYHLEYVPKKEPLDEVVTQDGVEVLVEGRALLTVLGSTMDWVDERLGSRFVFSNPNIKEQCGCGESFMV